MAKPMLKDSKNRMPEGDPRVLNSHMTYETFDSPKTGERRHYTAMEHSDWYKTAHCTVKSSEGLRTVFDDDVPDGSVHHVGWIPESGGW